jgi:hypothetical protein
MRHFASVKALWLVPMLFASYALADEAADRIAISRVITTLNDSTQPSALFTQRGYYEFEGLRRAHPRAFQIFGPASSDATVTISHEPWGEATINLPGSESRPSIAFITPDVALADGLCTYEDDQGTKQTTPLLFVMKKEGGDWKIASIRVLAH